MRPLEGAAQTAMKDRHHEGLQLLGAYIKLPTFNGKQSRVSPLACGLRDVSSSDFA